MDAGPSTSTASPPRTPRQREKAPLLADVMLPPNADNEITALITEYLQSRHPRLAEALAAEIGPAREEIEAVERAILDGDFSSIEALLAPGLLGPQTQKAFLYMCYREQFLEYIDNRESQKAFNLLQKRLKPLEHYQPVPYDFYSLAYLTSASTVHDAPGLRDWAGAGPEREKLVQMWRELTDDQRNVGATDTAVRAPRDRLVTLLQQAAAWQVAASKPRGAGPFALPSLLSDYAPLTVPSRLERLIKGHRANIKCVDWITDGLGVSGSSDSTLHIFSVEDGTTRRVLSGHQSRLWDVATSPEGRLIASGSGDGTVRIWTTDGECASVLAGDGGDVYGVAWQPGGESHIASACYDKILRLWNVETGKLIRTFSGHTQSALGVAYDPTGRVLASGSKDKHIRLWDAVGGVCVQTMTAHVGEVTSVEFDHEGKYLLAGCKDNSNRLWDLRMQRNIYRYTGHQNTSKNIIRCAFASPSSSLIAGGSEDGLVYLWEREGAPGDESMRHSTFSTPELGAASGPMTHNGFRTDTPTTYSTVPLGHSTRGPGFARDGRLPTYLPPRSFTRASSGSTQGGTVTTTVRPLKALAGHGAGAVFDVRARGDTLLSAGGDGAVGVWGE